MNCRRCILFSAGALVGLSLLTTSARGGLVVHYDVSDSSTVVDLGGANPGDSGFNRRIETIMDKAGGDHNGTQDGGVLGYNDGSSGPFNGNPYVTTSGGNILGFPDPAIDNITWVAVFQSDTVGVTNSIGQMPVAGEGAIMYQRTLATTPDQGGGSVTRPGQLMVGIRGGKEFLSLDNMFDGEPTIMAWTYGGGPIDPTGIGDRTSLQFYKNGARWGPVETCCGIGGAGGGLPGETLSSARIGREFHGPGVPGANWAEIRIYDEVLSNADRRAVFGELGEKYGIVPEPHALLLLAIGVMGLPLLRRWFR